MCALPPTAQSAILFSNIASAHGRLCGIVSRTEVPIITTSIEGPHKHNDPCLLTQLQWSSAAAYTIDGKKNRAGASQAL